MKTIYFGLIIVGLFCELFAINSIHKYGIKRPPKIWKPLLFLSISGLISDLASLIMIFISDNNFLLLYFYGLSEIICFYLIFKFLSTKKTQKILINTLFIIQLIVLMLEMILTNGESNNFYSNILNKLVVIVLSVIYSFKEYKNISTENYSISTLIILLIFAFTSYIGYVGGHIIILSFPGSQKVRNKISIHSSLPFPKICPLVH